MKIPYPEKPIAPEKPIIPVKPGKYLINISDYTLTLESIDLDGVRLSQIPKTITIEFLRYKWSSIVVDNFKFKTIWEYELKKY